MLKMKKYQPSKSISRRVSSPDKKPIGDFRGEIAARIMASLKKAFGCDTLEGVHRVSWRRYLLVVAIPFFGMIHSLPAWAAVTTDQPASSVKMTSKEGKSKLVLTDTRTAKEKQTKKEEMVTKTVSGRIGSKNKQGFALVYEVDEKKNTEIEMWLPLSERVNLKGYKTLQDAEEGDQVYVTYEETKEGGNKRSVKQLTLKKKKPKELTADENSPLGQ